MGSAAGRRNSFSPDNLFHLYSSHTQYTPSNSSAENELLEITEGETSKEQRTRLIPMQKLIAGSVRILQSSEILNRQVKQFLAD